MNTYWLSFASDIGFLGAVLTRADTKEDALKKVTNAGLNPGGEALIIQAPDLSELPYPFDCLLSEEYLRGNGEVKLGELESEDKAACDDLIDSNGILVCEGCNETNN